jgi:ATP-dependent Lhr-like helicase
VQNLINYLREQREHTGTLPTDQAITVERFRDELGDWRVCILSPFGARVHAPWAMSLQRLLSAQSGFEIQVMYADDGIVLRFADTEELPSLDVLVPAPEDAEELVTEQLAETALFAGLFRENAVRSLLLPRRRPGQRNPLWAQRLKAQELLAAVRQYPSFPLVLETYRQALSDVFDLAAFKQILADIRARRVRLDEVETPSASPFARSLVFAYVATYIYEQDAPLAERKAQALTLDRNLLAELLGQAELRELIDPETLEALEQELQHLCENRRARDADELHDLLRHLGDLTEAELAVRSRGRWDVWIRELARERRAALITISGERHWIAAEDAALYRDALGTVPPPGLPQAFLKPTAQPLEQLARRYARTHGPFAARWLARRYELRSAEIESVLHSLEAAGAVIQGEIRPGGAELDWCDTDVLRRLKRRTLAHLRQEVAPAEAETLGRFLTAWHGIGEHRQGPQYLLRSVSQLQGLALPWSALHEVILPSRVNGFSLDALDMLAAGGQLAWVGCGALGARDGRIALYLREEVGKLLEPPVRCEAASPLHRAILEHLKTKGASFLLEVEEAVHRAEPTGTGDEFEAALWDLVWEGQITNDTFAPLRSLARGRARTQRGRWRSGHSLAGGRWSLVTNLVDPAVSATERSVAWAHLLLERYGIVSREAAVGEAIPGGFGALYRVLSALEESGRIRRGYFVEALSGAQFAYAGAVDRLRGMRPPTAEDAASLSEKDVQMVPTVDPANPWGTLLPWPQSGGGAESRPRRVAGAWVISVRGKPILYLGTKGGQLLTFPAMIRDEQELELALRALQRVPRQARRGALVLEKVDGVAARESVHFERLRTCGFITDYRGLATCRL